MIHYLSVPLVIICKDRINYLDAELKSISATCPPFVSVCVSNDGTKDERMLQYLTTQQVVELDAWKFPEGNLEWESLGISLANPPCVVGAGGKFNSILHAVSAGTKNLGLAVKWAFERTGAAYVIKMEDDLVFVQNWYVSLIRAMIGSGCGLLSGFRYFYGNPKMRSMNECVEEVYEGYTGGQLMICSRTYFEKCPYVFNNEITTIWDNDDLWINECRKHGMKFGVMKRSVCQHVGFHTESKQKAFCKDGKLLKVDPNVRSIMLGGDVRQFRIVH